MKLIVFSDVHGNLPALELMLKHAGTVDGYICLGDSVDYGPWSNECVDLIQSLPNCTYVMGNHERYFIDGTITSASNIAREFFDVCYPDFSRQQQIADLPQQYELNGFSFRHTINDQNIYPDSPVSLDNNYVIGHSHHQFKLEQPPYLLINAGSVGQNRQYINVINYLTLDTDNMAFGLEAFTYDEQLIIQEMKARKYPAACIAYYDSKPRLTS